MRAVLVVACAAALAGRASAAEPRIAHERFVLANGLRVLLVPDRSAPTIAVVTWFDVGSKDEVPGRTGLAHLFEHLMFKGSPHVPDGVMDDLVEAAGGWSNAFTEQDETVYVTVASAGFLERALWLEADRIGGLTDAIDQAKLDNQRDVVLNERRETHENQPYGMAEILIGEALWPEGYGYHWPIIGDPGDLGKASLADVKAFFSAHYRPDQAILVIAGDFEPAAARALIERYLGWLPRGGGPGARSYPVPAPLAADVTVASEDDVQTARLYLTWRGPRAFSPDEPALDLASSILGDGKSSRLYRRLVVRDRIAQDVATGTGGLALCGSFQIATTVTPGVEPARLREAIDEELADFLRSPPTAEELERVKAVREARFLAQLESLASRAEQLAAYEARLGDADYLARDLARYRAVTAADVQAVARRYLGHKRVDLVIGPRK